MRVEASQLWPLFAFFMSCHHHTLQMFHVLTHNIWLGKFQTTTTVKSKWIRWIGSHTAMQ